MVTLVAEPPAPAPLDAPAPVEPARETRRHAVRQLLDDRGLCAVLVAVVIWCAVMYLHVWRRHDRFGTFAHDLGFHDHYVWLLARGWGLSDVLGLHAFGHNATFGYLLLAPLSWLGLGPQGLNLILTVAVGLGAVPLYLLARDRLGDPWRAAPLGLVWLLHPIVQGNVWETFHPEALAMAPLLAAYLCASRRRWRPFALWILVALIWKSDVALFVAMLGVLIAIRWDRRIGVRTLVIGLAWFAITVGWMIPHAAGGGTVFGPLYGDLGDSPTDVAKTAITDPTDVGRRVVEHRPVQYGRDLVAPFAFLPLLSPGPLLLAAPQAVVNLLSGAEFTRIWTDSPHYQALPVVAMALALVETIGRLNRRRPVWAGRAIGLAMAAAIAGTVAWGSLPPLATQQAHYWPADGDPARGAKEEAVSLIPGDAAVTAHYLFVPHLTHRRTVFTFPNPWVASYYGVEETKLPEPTRVEFLLMDVSLLDPNDQALWDCLTDSGAFFEVFDRDGIVLGQRRPGADADLACAATQS